MKTLETLEVGDLVSDKLGTPGVIRTIIYRDEHSSGYACEVGTNSKLLMLSSIEMFSLGFKPVTSSIPEYTMEEAIAKVGHPFKIKK